MVGRFLRGNAVFLILSLKQLFYFFSVFLCLPGARYRPFPLFMFLNDCTSTRDLHRCIPPFARA